MNNKLNAFLMELEQLSAKHGLWIEKNENNGIDLVNDNIEVIASDLHFDGEKQSYTVKW